nr:hypothetical protein [uncultured Pseudomonas sp.]
MMKIACLAWGSLIWKPGDLQLAGQWHADGPAVPVEFCRVADGGELSTAICLGASCVDVLWARLATLSLEEACAQLAEREAIPAGRHDGVGTLLVHEDDGVDGLNRWALRQGLDAVIWTALPPRYLDIESRIPTAVQAITYLDGLEADTRTHARDYIQQVPAQIATGYRPLFADKLGW